MYLEMCLNVKIHANGITSMRLHTCICATHISASMSFLLFPWIGYVHSLAHSHTFGAAIQWENAKKTQQHSTEAIFQVQCCSKHNEKSGHTRYLCVCLSLFFLLVECSVAFIAHFVRLLHFIWDALEFHFKILAMKISRPYSFCT